MCASRRWRTSSFPTSSSRLIVGAYDDAIAQLRDLGARVDVERIPFDFAALGAKNGRIIGIEGYAQHRAIIDDEHADVDPGVRARMLIGKAASAADYIDALAERSEGDRGSSPSGCVDATRC